MGKKLLIIDTDSSALDMAMRAQAWGWQVIWYDKPKKDGSWSAGGRHGSSMGKAIGTALTVLCLEAQYRYTPLYGLGHEPPEQPIADALAGDQLPSTPLFRHAKYLESLNSPGNDTSPVVTDHGDFLYFASDRDGGLGGSDIYRARISGENPTPPKNAGAEINSAANETAPAVRMAGFHLLFNSDRDGEAGALYSAKSRRLVRRHNYARLPGLAWIMRNSLWLLIFAGSGAACYWCTKRALARNRKEPEPPPSADSLT